MLNPRRWAILLAALLALGAGWWVLATPPPPEPPPFLPEDDDGRGAELAPDLLRAEGTTTRLPAAKDAGPTSGQSQLMAALTGFVLDEGDNPIAGARVEVRPIDPEGLRGAFYPDGEPLGHTASDRDGAFRLAAAFGSQLRVIASAKGHATVGRRVASSGGHVILKLPPASTLQVTVLDEEGRAIPEAHVTAALGDTRLSGSTDGTGVLLFGALPAGAARLRVGAAGFGLLKAGPFAVQAGRPASALVVLPRGIQILGTIRDAQTGAPLAKAEVYIAHSGRSDHADPTGSDGRYGPLPGGGLLERVFVSVHAKGYAVLLESVVLNAEKQQTVDLALERADAWSGEVRTADGRPAVGARVAYTADGVAGRAPDSTTSDDKGHFSLPPPPPPLPSRRVVLTATLGGASAALALRPDSLRPVPLLLQLAPGTRVGGRVADATGTPLPGVLIQLVPDRTRMRDHARPNAEASRLLAANYGGLIALSGASGPDGTWMLQAIPAGPYRIHFEWPGGSHWRAETLQVAGTASDAGSETLGQGGHVAGRVTDSTGQAIAGARVRLEPASDPRHTHRTTSGHDGWFEFVGVGPGSQRLRATFGTLAPVELDIETVARGERRIDLSFEEGAVLVGRVTKGGAPYRGLLTVWLRRDGRARADRAPYSLRVSDGQFRLADVRVGRWLVEVRAPGGLFAHSSVVEVDAARVTPLQLELRAQAALRGSVRGSGGAPSSSASVMLVHEDDGRRHLVTTDAAGHFRFPVLAPGNWRIRAVGTGGAPIEESVHVGIGQSHSLDLKLAPAGSLNVLVVDASGRALPEVLVLFRRQQRVVRSGGPLRTDRRGRLLKHDLPLGEIEISARTVDGLVGGQVAEVKPDRTTDVKITVGEREGR